MIVPPFESEYDDADLPQILGAPLGNAVLDAHVSGMDPSSRVESSQQNLIVEAVESFYLAKNYVQIVGPFGGYTNAVVPRAIDSIGRHLLRLAVIAIATVNDGDRQGRSKSLPHAIQSLESALGTVTNQSVTPELQTLANIKSSINPDVHLSLKYVRHVRNKWAGHASLDREFDSWAGADVGLSLPLLEDALVRLVNAQQELASAIESSPVLGQLVARSQTGRGSSAGPIPFGVHWGAVVPLTEMTRAWTERAARALLDQLQSPPGYGTEADTDFGPDSRHQRLRATVDKAARQALPGDSHP